MATGSLRLQVKPLVVPFIAIDTMIASMRKVYRTADIQVNLVGTATLELAELCDLDVGNCDGSLTPAQTSLFSHRESALRNDVVIYIVRTVLPPSEGCASHPADRPGAVLAQTATEWALAHEVGHVLGLAHVDDDDYLMTGNGTENITNPPPRLSETEIATMHQSPLVTHETSQLAAVADILQNHLSYEQKLEMLPADAHQALAAIAEYPDSAIASRAVYLASLQRTPAAAEIVRRGLRHPAVHVRVSAAAALKNLAPRHRSSLLPLVRRERDAGVVRVARGVVGPDRKRAREEQRGAKRR